MTALLFGLAGSPDPPRAVAAPVIPAVGPTPMMLSATIRPASPTDFAGPAYAEAVERLRATRANYVTLMVPLCQRTLATSAVWPCRQAPSDEALAAGIRTARRAGLRVSIKVHVDTASPVEWHANIDPADRAAWFASYTDHLTHYGRVAEEAGADRFCLGVELTRLTDPSRHADTTERWLMLIKSVRAVFHGRLTYTAQWGDRPSSDQMRVGFWPALDEISIAGYFPVPHYPDPDGMDEDWDDNARRFLIPLATRYRKPVVLGEVGYRSRAGAHERPWDNAASGDADLDEQAELYDALLRNLTGLPWFGGLSLWYWSSPAEPAEDTSYTPWGKPAERYLRWWFTAAAVGHTRPGSGRFITP